MPLMSEGRPWAEGCQGAAGRRRPLSLLVGASALATPEKVTRSRRALAMAVPTPLTRCSPSSDPKGPKESRLATIRAASAGPILGRDSMAAAGAKSRSMILTADGGRRTADGDGAGVGAADSALRFWAAFYALRLRRAARPASRLGERATAESTRAIWAARSLGDPCTRRSPPRAARHAFTPTPRAATAAKKSNAWRSAGVGMQQLSSARPARHHRCIAGGGGLSLFPMTFSSQRHKGARRATEDYKCLE